MENIKSSSLIKPIDLLESFVISILPIIALYQVIPGIEVLNVGYVALLLIVFIKLLKNKFQIRFNLRILLIFSIFIILNSLSGLTSLQDYDLYLFLTNDIGILFFMFLCSYYCSMGRVKISLIYPFLKTVAICSTCFLFIQFISYYFFNIVIEGRLPFLVPIQEGFKSIYYGRPTSLFLEPSHFAEYIAPIYVLSLLRKEYYFSFFLFLGLILSTSSIGIFIAIFMPFVLFLKETFLNFPKINLKVFVLFSIFIFSFLYGLFFLKNTYKGFESIIEDLSIVGTFKNTRVFGRIFVFKYFSFKELTIGIGINRLGDFMIANNIVSKNSFDLNMASSFLFAFFSFGFIGGFIFIYFIFSLLKPLKKEFVILWLVIIFILLSEQILFNRTFLYLLILYYSLYTSNLKHIRLRKKRKY